MASCAVCFLAVGFQNGMSAFILPVAQCDMDLTSAQMGILNASFILGKLFAYLKKSKRYFLFDAVVFI